MKKFISMMIAVPALIAGLTTTAFACDSDTSICPDSIQGFQIDSFAGFGGFGASVATGDQVANLVEKEGGSATDVSATIGGDSCGLDCNDIAISGSMSAWEQVHVMSAAAGEQSGEQVGAVNEGGSFSSIGFTFQKYNISSPSN